MIRGGYPIKRIAEWLQHEMCEYTDVNTRGLITTLYRYKESMSPSAILDGSQRYDIRNAKRKLAKGLDELDALEKSYDDLRERIRIGMQMERGRRANRKREAIPAHISDSVTKLFSEVTTILSRRHKIKMDLGVIGKPEDDMSGVTINRELENAVAESYGGGAKKALSNPESRAKVLSIMEAISRRNAESEEEAQERENRDLGDSPDESSEEQSG